jgi:Putative Actinobacterial Holin-X, holin superfamily III
VTAPTTTPTSVSTSATAGVRSPVTSGADGASEKSLGELVATATKDLSLLVSQEVALAKAELKKEVAHAGKGAGMLGGAGFLGLFALIFLSISLAYAISWFGIGLGWGFFIVGMLYLVVAGVLALLGKKQLSKVGPPEKTIATVKDDVAWAKHATRP